MQQAHPATQSIKAAPKGKTSKVSLMTNMVSNKPSSPTKPPVDDEVGKGSIVFVKNSHEDPCPDCFNLLSFLKLKKEAESLDLIVPGSVKSCSASGISTPDSEDTPNVSNQKKPVVEKQPVVKEAVVVPNKPVIKEEALKKTVPVAAATAKSPVLQEANIPPPESAPAKKKAAPPKKKTAPSSEVAPPKKSLRSAPPIDISETSDGDLWA